METKPRRIPRNRNVNGSLIIHKLIQCGVAESFGLERDDLIMIIF